MSVSNLNMDVRQRIIIDSNSLEWIPSPLAGVERRMLEREHEEAGHATSIVRYAPDSYFRPHKHSAGEEYLVLEGVFSDESGDYGPGFYVRNPPGSEHKPFSAGGCTIFVKLCQMLPEGEPQIAIDTRSSPITSGDVSGHTIQPLFKSNAEEVRLERIAPGTSIDEGNKDGLEILVLDGDLELDHYPVIEPAWIRVPPGTPVTLMSEGGCWLWSKRGHLSARLT
jgi:quercetin dioxygenase-like cupin family protein